MLPDVGSTIVPPGLSRPDSSAASIMRTAIRSFTDPPGLKYSTFARTVAAEALRDVAQAHEGGVSDQINN